MRIGASTTSAASTSTAIRDAARALDATNPASASEGQRVPADGFRNASPGAAATASQDEQLNGLMQARAARSSAAAAGQLSLPERPQNAMTGKQFADQMLRLPLLKREDAILREVLKGNVPDFLRDFHEIPVTTRGQDGVEHKGKVRVLPDYVAIGSNEDFVRAPMSPITAQKIADAIGCSLPTKKVVDDVYAQAEVKLDPERLTTPVDKTGSAEYFQPHEIKVEQQRAGERLGALTAGHKKDVVLSNRLDAHQNRVCIYGWHDAQSHPTQPLSTAHHDYYSDYSHGVRLMSGTMEVDGVERPVAEVMRDPALAGLLSDEGVIRTPRMRGQGLPQVDLRTGLPVGTVPAPMAPARPAQPRAAAEPDPVVPEPDPAAPPPPAPEMEAAPPPPPAGLNPTGNVAADTRLEALQGLALDFAMAEWKAGVRELSPNRSPRIDEYAKKAMIPLGSEWCGLFDGFNLAQAGFQDRAALASYVKARDFFLYQTSLEKPGGPISQKIAATRAKQEAEGSERRYFLLDGADSPTAKLVRTDPRRYGHYDAAGNTFDYRSLPIRPGDTALFSRSHVAMVESYDPQSGLLETVEGNASGTGVDGKLRHEAVVRKSYDLTDPAVRKQFDGFGRPALGDFEPPNG